jgi:hypothetical protein
MMVIDSAVPCRDNARRWRSSANGANAERLLTRCIRVHEWHQPTVFERLVLDRRGPLASFQAVSQADATPLVVASTKNSRGVI